MKIIKFVLDGKKFIDTVYCSAKNEEDTYIFLAIIWLIWGVLGHMYFTNYPHYYTNVEKVLACIILINFSIFVLFFTSFIWFQNKSTKVDGLIIKSSKYLLAYTSIIMGFFVILPYLILSLIFKAENLSRIVNYLPEILISLFVSYFCTILGACFFIYLVSRFNVNIFKMYYVTFLISWMIYIKIFKKVVTFSMKLLNNKKKYFKEDVSFIKNLVGVSPYIVSVVLMVLYYGFNFDVGISKLIEINNNVFLTIIAIVTLKNEWVNKVINKN